MTNIIHNVSVPLPPAPPLPTEVPHQLQLQVPVGSIITFAGEIAGVKSPSSPPAPQDSVNDVEAMGYMFCDGRALNSAQYPALFAVIGYRYSKTKSGEVFNVPDCRGYFIRGVDPKGLVDKDRKKKKQDVGTKQEFAMQTHKHIYDTLNSAKSTTPEKPVAGAAGESTLTGTPTSSKDDIPGEVKVSSTETRPVNINFYILIKCL